MSLIKEHIGELYYRSNSIRFDEQGPGFELSAHLDNPELPLSPYYLHYPKAGEPGSELLPELIKYCGMALYSISVDEQIAGNKLAAVPSGADPIANEVAHYSVEYPKNLIRFSKQQDGKNTNFTYVNGVFNEGDPLTIIDDHTSGGRNNRLFQIAAQGIGLEPTHALSVVDREQGAVDIMAHHSVVMRSIFTITELFDYGRAEGHLSQDMYDRSIAYKSHNLIPTER